MSEETLIITCRVKSINPFNKGNSLLSKRVKKEIAYLT